jgi:hypothetical protein
MRDINFDKLVIGGEFNWVETWKLRRVIIGPRYFFFVVKRVSLWMLGFPLALLTAAGLRTLCGRPGFTPLSALFHLLVICLVLGGATGLAFEFGARDVTIYKDQVFIIAGWRVFWRLLLNRRIFVRVTPVGTQITRMDFYSQGRASPKMVRGCPFEAARVVEWFQTAGINVELVEG